MAHFFVLLARFAAPCPFFEVIVIRVLVLIAIAIYVLVVLVHRCSRAAKLMRGDTTSHAGETTAEGAKVRDTRRTHLTLRVSEAWADRQANASSQVVQVELQYRLASVLGGKGAADAQLGHHGHHERGARAAARAHQQQ